ncbi:hypothetical protein ACFFIX_20300 [Metabacillus herbersteinensis]|uniref:Uncharacterized protein n=1 Tax=Metabacillus herbersteinensis TaxID=283816 RepID=A0ABV6GJ48_9BACI
MNTILHFADAALQYSRGKQTGLWGLIGIVLAILTIKFWDNLQPIFEFLGIVALLDKLGLIHETAPEMTFFHIFVASVGLYILLVIVGLVLLGIVVGLLAFSQNEIGQKVILASLYLIFLPFIAFYGLCKLILFAQEKQEEKRDPEAYTEKKRLEKNKNVLDYLIHAGVEKERIRLEYRRELELDQLSSKDWEAYKQLRDEPIYHKEDNSLSYTEAYNRLNRLPTTGDSFFLLGVSFDREIFILLPRPVTPLDNSNKCFYGEKMDIKGKVNQILINNKWTFEFQLEIKKGYSISELDSRSSYTNILEDLPHKTFEHFLDPRLIEELKETIETYHTSSLYSTFVEHIQDQYFNQKERLKRLITDADTAEKFDRYVQEISDYNAGNEGVVYHIWENNKKANHSYY